jgi:hypothetical protein
MSDKTPFFQEVRRKLMVRGDGWKPVIENLHNHIEIAEVEELLQSVGQLVTLHGVGHIAGSLVETTLNPGAILPFLPMPDDNYALQAEMTLENVTLQWLYRFLIVEGLCEHARREPLEKWPPMFLHMVHQGLQFMLYMAALLVIIEEQPNPNLRNMSFCTRDGFWQTEGVVKERIRKACEFLHPKAQDYGESFRRHGLPGILPRLWDKIARYAQLKADNRSGNFEKLEDSAKDLLGYCCIAYSLILELPEGVRKGYQPSAVYETESNVMEGAEWKKTK